MPRPESLRLRVALISTFDQLAARLADHDESALLEAVDRLQGIALTADCDVMSQVMKAMARVLEEQQGQIDNAGFQW
jgi:hypothetical protein